MSPDQLVQPLDQDRGSHSKQLGKVVHKAVGPTGAEDDAMLKPKTAGASMFRLVTGRRKTVDTVAKHLFTKFAGSLLIRVEGSRSQALKHTEVPWELIGPVEVEPAAA